MRYRVERLRTGRVVPDEWAVTYLARAISIPVLALFDWVTWPIVGRTLGRGPWWVVELRWNEQDADLVRVAQGSTKAEARSRRSALGA